MNQDTGKFRTNTKDQYYTKEAVAKKCIQKVLQLVPDAQSYQWVEPSAGNGRFFQSVPASFDKIGIDIEPKAPQLLQGDFLKWTPLTQRKRIFFGNPPFGRQGSLAKSFIKHSAQFADVIAFILPRSFVKPSMSNAFPRIFHCLLSEELEKNAFEVNGDEYDVPCVFQIWQKKEEERVLPEPVKEEGFQYVKSTDPFDIALKRVGGLAGQCSLEKKDYNPQYHYFLKLDKKYIASSSTIVAKVNQHIFPSNTTGPRSLSKSEVNEVLNLILASCS